MNGPNLRTTYYLGGAIAGLAVGLILELVNHVIDRARAQ